MARRVKSAVLDNKEARGRLKVQGKPYYVAIDAGLHLGYRKGKTGGKWVLRSYRGNQGYLVETFGTADDRQDADGVTVLDFWQAQAKARELHRRVQRRASGLSEEPDGPYTVKNCADDYVAWLEDNGKPTLDTVTRFKNYILPDLGAIEVNELTTKQIENWHKKMARRAPRARTLDGKKQNYREFDSSDQEVMRKRRSTANRTLTILRAALNRAWRSKGDLIESDKAWRKVEPFRNVDAARVRYLSIEEGRRLINACEPDLRMLVQGALATGARYGELCKMNCADYDAANGTVHVLTSKSGKARHIHLADEGVELFNQLTAGQPGAAPIFRKEGGSRWGKSHQSRPFNEAVARAKIEGASFHTLRHTWASLAVMNKAPLLVVAENLGHSDTRMVERHYGHLAKDYVKETIRATAPRFGMVEESNVERIGERS